MAISGFREILPREFSRAYGSGATGGRTFVVTCDENTTTQNILDAIGIADGAPHPEYAGLFATGVSVSRNGDDSVQVEYNYDTEDKADTNPVARPAEWSFSSGGVAIPALSYYLGSGNGDIKPLTNAVGEYVWEGLTQTITEVKATIVQNKLLLDQGEFARAGCVNSGTYLWGSQYTWQCTSVGASKASDKVGDQIQRYWRMTYELSYRSTGWYFNLPHVGWGYKDGNRYERCKIFNDAQDLVPSPKPMPLNQNGGLKYPEGENGVPDRILRRVHPEIDFSVFGFPPQ